ncbi:MAG: hypothetical protein ACOYN4_19170 [Bacteroidales bacterium]
MKRFKSLILISALAIFSLASCEKSEDIVPSIKNDMEDIKFDGTFNWSTGSPVTLNITGLPTVVPVKNTLTISLQNGSTVFSLFHSLDQSLTLNLTVPSTEKELRLNYGSTTYTVFIVNNKVDFSFIPVIQD